MKYFKAKEFFNSIVKCKDWGEENINKYLGMYTHNGANADENAK